MSCGNCAARLQKAFSEKQGINANVNFATKTLSGEYDESVWSEKKIAELVDVTGYQAVFPKENPKAPSCGAQKKDTTTIPIHPKMQNALYGWDVFFLSS